MNSNASDKEPRASDKPDSEHIHLWGRDIDHDDFMEGHYADDRHKPTPEGGQAGIAQGNTGRRTTKGRRKTKMG